MNCNFGQKAFQYTGVSGDAWGDLSLLPAPDIADGSDYFGTDLWTGNDATRDITVADSQGNTWAPDLVWIKMRNSTMSHYWYDIVRGAAQSISSDSNRIESTDVGRLTAFNTDGYELGSSSRVNSSPNTYVGWSWLAGGSVSADNNTDGDITSTVSANPTAGFSIVSYEGNGLANQTIGHGLGVAPSMVIVKNRDDARSWAVLHTSVGFTGTTLDGSPEYYMMQLDDIYARTDFGTDCIWNPTNTTFKVAATTNALWVNASNNSYIAYCFAEVEGYSKIGAFTGNGNTDGAFVHCGFRPAWVLIKRSHNTSDWVIWDSTRNTYNALGDSLAPNTNLAETPTPDRFDFLSNGFKMRTTAFPNDATAKIFVAFAENPFGGEGVSPATAR